MNDMVMMLLMLGIWVVLMRLCWIYRELRVVIVVKVVMFVVSVFMSCVVLF